MAADNGHSEKLKRKDYEKHLRKLQIELCRLQDWVKAEGARVIIIFEGRDAAGKGGTIKAIAERVSPRVFRFVALPAPSDREKSQMYLQRYITQFPAAGEMVIFDRSWYNRAGVEYVMNFVDKDQHRRFLQLCPEMEKYIVEAGIRLIKIWLEVGQKEQERRFNARIDDPMRQWKLSTRRGTSCVPTTNAGEGSTVFHTSLRKSRTRKSHGKKSGFLRGRPRTNTTIRLH
jgi:polyphosphate kinase 2